MNIERVLDSVCRVLPYVEENSCQTFINNNYDEIVKAIQVGTDPVIACTVLMVCDGVKSK